jgi:hypothetical protein
MGAIIIMHFRGIAAISVAHSQQIVNHCKLANCDNMLFVNE